jgi:hypothetical protein
MAGKYDGPGTFALQLEAFRDRYAETAGKTVDNVLRYLCESFVNLSPVDTGNFRYNWQFTVGAPPSSALPYPGYTLPGNQPGGDNDFIVGAEVTIKRLEDQRRSFKLGDVAYIYNLTYYGVPLEYGFSDKAPRGMVRTTVSPFYIVVDRAVREAREQS